MPDNWNFDFRKKKIPKKMKGKEVEVTALDRFMVKFYIAGLFVLLAIAVIAFILKVYFIIVFAVLVWVGGLIGYELYLQYKADKKKNHQQK